MRQVVGTMLRDGLQTPPPPSGGIHHPGLLSPFRCRVRLQALWRGMIPGQLLTVPYCSIQFVTAHQAKALAKRTGMLGMLA